MTLPSAWKSSILVNKEKVVSSSQNPRGPFSVCFLLKVLSDRRT